MFQRASEHLTFRLYTIFNASHNIILLTPKKAKAEPKYGCVNIQHMSFSFVIVSPSGQFFRQVSVVVRGFLFERKICGPRVFGVVCRGIYSCRLSPPSAWTDWISSSQLTVPWHQIYSRDGQSTSSARPQNIHSFAHSLFRHLSP